ncbi:hypothetical protein BX666DRAFT_1610157 [Dichotomocladium elegans]|nr:hypothetical protein BX666DRAFT_1610157 [Dichotomocladium elegans]
MASSRCFCLRLLPPLLPLMLLPLVLLLVRRRRRRRPSSFLPPTLPPSMLNSSKSFLSSLFRYCYLNGTPSYLRVCQALGRRYDCINRDLYFFIALISEKAQRKPVCNTIMDGISIDAMRYASTPRVRTE